MKERKRKAKKDRTYDSEGYTRRAGCLCFRTDREEEVRKLVWEDQRVFQFHDPQLRREGYCTNSILLNYLICNVIETNCSITTSGFQIIEVIQHESFIWITRRDSKHMYTHFVFPAAWFSNTMLYQNKTGLLKLFWREELRRIFGRNSLHFMVSQCSTPGKAIRKRENWSIQHKAGIYIEKCWRREAETSLS